MPRRIFATRYERARAVGSLLLYAAISGRNGGMSNEGATRSSKREKRAGNKPALILILSGATGRARARQAGIMPSYLFNSPLYDGEKFQNSGS